MSLEPIRCTLVTSIITIFACAWTARAGDLNPPAGPVAPTMKTLVEVEPRIAINAVNTPGDADAIFKITQPGSYYLSGNIIGEAGKAGIEIAVGGVTLDLMGFELAGVPGSFSGIRTTTFMNNLDNITIRNGSLRSWGQSGIELLSITDTRVRISDINSSSNTQSGIRAGFGSTVARCTAAENGATGFDIEGGATLTDCVAFFNSGRGILCSNSTVTGCTTNANGTIGIAGSSGSTVTGCTANGNTEDGIFVISGSTVSGCTASFNDGDGIEAQENCRIIGNTCNGNGDFTADGAGIHIRSNGTDNRIEGNNCTDNDRGIDVDAAGNFIARNTCSGNNVNNWDVVAGNVCLVVSATTAGAILGNSGGSAPGSTDPNANFTY